MHTPVHPGAKIQQLGIIQVRTEAITLIDTQYPAYGAYTEYNVTNLVKGWKNGTYTASLGFMLKSTNESNVNNAKAFDASESAYSSVQPYIVVTYRPLIFLQYYSLNLNEGESCSNLAITNPTTTVQWSSSDPSVATVSSSGVITGIRASATPVTITATALDPYCPASATCTVYVKIPDGTYFFKNKATGLYAEPTGYLEGNEVYQWALGGSTAQRWTVEYLSNGVYRIKNQMSDLYLAVESLNNTSAKATQYSTASDLSRWYISRTSSGAFCLYAKGNLSSGYVIGSAFSGNTNGTSIKNMLYSSDTNYKDEWFFEVRLDTALEGQRWSKWCWVASARMFSNHYYDVTRSQNQAVQFVKGSVIDQGGWENESQSAIGYYISNISEASLTLQNVISNGSSNCRRYPENVLRHFLDDGHAVFITRSWYDGTTRTGGHSMLIIGYVTKTVNNSIQYQYIIYDPWPESVPDPWNSPIATTGQSYLRSYQWICNGLNALPDDGGTDHGIWEGYVTVVTTYSNDSVLPIWNE